MTDENTKDLTTDEKLDRILAELADLKAWRVTVEALIDDRLKETRPKLDLLLKEMSDSRVDIAELVASQSRLEQKFDVLLDDSTMLRAQQKGFERRLSALERPPN